MIVDSHLNLAIDLYGILRFFFQILVRAFPVFVRLFPGFSRYVSGVSSFFSWSFSGFFPAFLRICFRCFLRRRTGVVSSSSDGVARCHPQRQKVRENLDKCHGVGSVVIGQFKSNEE